MNICKNFQQISSKIFAIFHLCYILRDVHQIVQSCFMVYADVAELADAHGSGPCSARIEGSTPSVGTIYSGRLGCMQQERYVRVWHNGCAPAFQAGYRGSTPLTRSISFWKNGCEDQRHKACGFDTGWDSRVAKGGRL